MLITDRAGHPAPACLTDERSAPGRAALRDLFSLDPERAAQRSFSMGNYVVEGDELLNAAARLFHGKCAFCESRAPLALYRFRPTEEAGPSHQVRPNDASRAHLYYAWLANAWENIYPICYDCRPIEQSVFPVLGVRRPLPSDDELEQNFSQPTASWLTDTREKPLFIDPCAPLDLRTYLAASPGGEMLGLNSRGEATIRHFNLDRPELQSRRRVAFNSYFVELREAVAGHARSGIFNFRSMEFGGAWYLLLYQIAQKIGRRSGPRRSLSITGIERYFADRVNDSTFDFLLRHAFFQLMEHPEQLRYNKPAPPPTFNQDAQAPVAFQIDRYKALEALKIRMPAPRDSYGAAGSTLVILGENAAGKSSLLEAMALSLVDQDTRRDLKLDANKLMLNPALMGAPERGEPVEGEVAALFPGFEARMAVRPGLDTLGTDDFLRLPVFAYGAFRLYIGARRKTTRSAPIRSLFEPDYVLSNPETWLASIHGKPEFDEVARVLKTLFGFSQKDDVIVVEDSVCKIRVTHSRPGQRDLVQDTPLSVVSSGFRSIMAMACDVMQGLLHDTNRFSAQLAQRRAIVFVDEIEAHLHPRWKMRIVHALREALPNVTFIMTTHDPLCLRGLKADEVMVFRRVEQVSPSGLPMVVEQFAELPDLGALTIEQILTSDFFQLYSTDGPEIEARFAKAADLFAAETRRDFLDASDLETLRQVRIEIGDQIRASLPVGSTEIERLVQEAVEAYIIKRRRERPDMLGALRRETVAEIASILEGL